MPSIDSSTENKIVIYQSKGYVLFNIFFALAALVACPLVLIMHPAVEAPVSHLRRLAIGYVGTPVVAFMFINCIRDFFSKKSVLALDDQGITVRNLAMIPWSQVAEVKAFRKNGKAYVGVVARDFDSLVRGYSEPQAIKFRNSQERLGVVAAVIEELLPMKVDDVIKQIGEYSTTKIQAN